MMSGPSPETISANKVSFALSYSTASRTSLIASWDLDELGKDSINNKRYGNSTILFERPASISKIEGREIRINCKTFFVYKGEQIPVSNFHQWAVLRFESYIIKITYSSAEQSFEEYFPAYAKAIETLTFIH
jgi:hypothetical protein